MHTEQIAWHSPVERMPDDDIDVLLHVPEHPGHAVWPGYRDADVWRWCTGFAVECAVAAWAEMPAGPAA